MGMPSEYQAYMRGWRDGAGGRIRSRHFTDHPTRKAPYERGYTGGTAAALRASEGAAALYGRDSEEAPPKAELRERRGRKPNPLPITIGCRVHVCKKCGEPGHHARTCGRAKPIETS